MQLIEGMKLATDAVFESGRFKGYLDPRYTCDQDNSSPELRWSEEPEGTVAFVLIAEETISNQAFWIVYGIPAGVHHLPAGIPPQDALPNGIRQGLNDQRKLGYSGPCPPASDAPHEYVFRLFALKATPELPNRVTRAALWETIAPHVLGEAIVRTRYHRALRESA